MSLRNQPYIPLYVQDFMTDERLNECSAAANGVYIRLMCLMHKSEEYGTILLKQKDKQNSSNIENFACKLVKNMPFTVEEIYSGLTELIEENVVQIEEDKLIQKRMVKDNYISEIRSSAGSKGGKKKQNENQNTDFASNFAKAKPKAKIKQNTENEYEYEIEIDNENINSLIEDVENFSESFDPYCSMQRKFFDAVYKSVFDKSPVMTNEDCLNLVEVATANRKDFFRTLKKYLTLTSKLNFKKIGYKPGAKWFLTPKNYADLRNGVYDTQTEGDSDNGFNY